MAEVERMVSLMDRTEAINLAIQQTRRIRCSACQGLFHLDLNDYAKSAIESPSKHTATLRTPTDCPHCGHKGEFVKAVSDVVVTKQAPTRPATASSIARRTNAERQIRRLAVRRKSVFERFIDWLKA